MSPSPTYDGLNLRKGIENSRHNPYKAAADVSGSTPTMGGHDSSRLDAKAQQHTATSTSTQPKLAAPAAQDRDTSSPNSSRMASQRHATAGSNTTATGTFPWLPVSLHPKCFLVRPAASHEEPGYTVPLIPLDLLPDHIEIVGLPRYLTPTQAAGMAKLGVIPSPADGAVYKLRIVSGDDEILPAVSCGLASPSVEDTDRSNNPPETGDMMTVASIDSTEDLAIFLSGERERDVAAPVGRRNATTTTPPPCRPVHSRAVDQAARIVSPSGRSTSSSASSSSSDSPVVSPAFQQHPADRMLQAMAEVKSSNMSLQTNAGRPKSSTTHTGVTSNNTTNHGSNSNHDGRNNSSSSNNVNSSNNSNSPGNRTFCKHWCHYGTCRYGLYCRYQHTMPTTLDGLQEVGLREIPIWFRSAMRLTLDERFATGFGGAGGQMGGMEPGHQSAGGHYMSGNGMGGGMGLNMGMGMMGMPMDMRLAAAMLGRGGNVAEPFDMTERTKQLQSQQQQRERERERERRRMEEKEKEKMKEDRGMGRLERLERLGILCMDKGTAGTDDKKDSDPDDVLGHLLEF